MFILGTRRSETAPNLAVHLRDCDAGYEIPDDEDYIINYGRKGVRDYVNLNKRVNGNKLEQLQKLARVVKVPEIMFADNPREIPRNVFPILARKIKHSKGKDIIFLKTRRSWFRRLRRVRKRDFFVKYIPKQDEFRVHVLGEAVAGISRKIRSDEHPSPHPHVWSRDRGWIQVDYDDGLYEELSELAIKSIKILELDFGAVDIILGRDDEFYVLEVNTAPRLNRRRRVMYAQFFRMMWKKWRRDERRRDRDEED